MAETGRDGPSDAPIQPDRLALEADLRRALAAGELSLVYQPVIDAKTRSLASVEALARWNCPGRGWVPPDQFIPVAEAAGMIEAVTDFVVQCASRELGRMLAGHPALKLSINLAAREVVPDRVGMVLDIATRGGLAPDRLQFEITERTLLGQSADVRAALETLVASGATLAIDDFGTGYSSLAYLDSYPIQCLKIDKSFVQRLTDSARTRKLTEAILLMAGALGMQTVAEGVETVDQLAFLIGKGCRYIQGYLFSKPLAVAPLEAFVAEFRFPDALLDAAMWPSGLTLPRLLADNQERALRLFVEHVPAAVAMFDSAMRYVAVSARWLANFRIVDPDVIGRCHYDVLPNTPQGWRDVHARALAGAVESGEDDFYIQPDGTREWSSWEVRPLTNPVGDVVGIIIFSERITARKRAEQRLNDFLATSSDWLWEMDADLRFLPGSRQTVDGQAPATDEGRLAWEMTSIAPGQTDLMRAHFADLTAHRPFRNLVYARRADGGEIEWREVSGRPVFADDGGFRGYRGTARDVTERQRAVAVLREKVVQLELAGDLAGLGYWQWDAATNTSLWSDEVFRITGRDPATMRLDDEASRYEIFHPEDRQAQADAIRMAMAEGKPFQRRARVLRPDGSVRVVWSSGRPERSEDGRVASYIGIMQDITAQSEVAAGLARSNEENRVFRAIIEALPDLVFAKDLDGRFIVANPATLAAFGLDDPSQLLGKSDRDVLSAETADGFARQEQSLMRDGGTVQFDHAFVVRGQTRIFSAIEAPLRDAAGHVVGLVGSNRDVTEERRARALSEARARENELYRLVFERLPDCVCVKDMDGRFVLANDAAVRMMGAGSVANLIGRHDRDYFPPERAALFSAQEQEILATGRARMVEEPYTFADGSYQGWKFSTKRVVRDTAGTVFGLVNVEHDVTELMQAREAAARERQTSELYRQGIENLPDLFYVKDTNHRFMVANHALAMQVGAASAAELIGRTDADFHSPDLAANYRASEAALMARGEVAMIEERSRRHDGTMGWFSTLKSPLRDASGTVIGLVGHGRDITQRKQAEAALQREIVERRLLAETLMQSRLEVERVRDTLAETAAVVSDGFALFDPDDRLVLCNKPYCGFFGLQPNDLVGRSFDEIVRLPRIRAALALDDAGFALWLDKRMASHRAADGVPLEVAYRSTWSLFQERRTKDGYVVLSSTDITHLKQAQEDARQLANRDLLTGLANRRSFLHKAGRRFGTGPHAGPAAVVRFDIDHFQAINDAYGHPAGDEVLRHLASSCIGWLRPSDQLARWGGGDLILLLPTADPKTVLLVVDRLRRGIAAMTSLSGDAYIRVTASFGVAVGDGAAGTLDGLIERAGEAMSRAKTSGRNRIEIAALEPSVSVVSSPTS